MADKLTDTALRRSPNSVANFLRLAALIGPLVNAVLERIIAVACENLRCLGRLVQDTLADGAGRPDVDCHLVCGLEMPAFVEVDLAGRRPVSGANGPTDFSQSTDLPS